MNTFGQLFRVSIFGESHGAGVGVTIEGFPKGKEIDMDHIQKRLNQRRPGTSKIVTQRKEADKPEPFSGVFEGRASGSPITFLIHNKDSDSSHYKERMFTPRPGHADYTAYVKYGDARDWRGGAHFSGRLTAPIVIAGAMAEQILMDEGMNTISHTVQIGEEEAPDVPPEELSEDMIHEPVRCADEEANERIAEYIDDTRKDLDSLGGVIETVVQGVPAGLGEVFFGRVDAKLAHICMSMPAMKGIEFGAGFDSAEMKGSEHNDPFAIEDGEVVTETNNAGGTLGGLTTGMPVVFRVVVKPTSSIPQEQKTVHLEEMEETTLQIKGRHDPCIVTRAVPVIQACASIAFADLVLLERSERDSG
jgi:chorismate synthase